MDYREFFFYGYLEFIGFGGKLGMWDGALLGKGGDFWMGWKPSKWARPFSGFYRWFSTFDSEKTIVVG